MASRTIVGCDNCGTEPADTLTINVGHGARMIDICPACQDVFGLAKLTQLLDDFGAPLSEQPQNRTVPTPRIHSERQGGPVICNVCNNGYADRNQAISHAVRAHKISLVDASKAVPTNSPPIICEYCGYVCSGRSGHSRHVPQAHRAEWDATRARITVAEIEQEQQLFDAPPGNPPRRAATKKTAR